MATETKKSFPLNPIDIGVIAVLAVMALGFYLVKTGRAGIAHVIRGKGVAQVDLLIHGGVEDPRVIKAGDKTFITIRNQPYAPVRIVSVKITPHMITMETPQGPQAVPDVADPYFRDILMTIQDKATLTSDGVVFGGNKIKDGVPIEVEGYKYRLMGTIVDVRLLAPAKGGHTGSAGSQHQADGKASGT